MEATFMLKKNNAGEKRIPLEGTSFGLCPLSIRIPVILLIILLSIPSLANGIVGQQLVEERVDSLINLAGMLQETGRYHESQEFSYQALEMATNLDYAHGIGRALSAIAVNYFRTGQYNQSLNFMEKGLEFARKDGQMRDVAIGLNNIGSIYTILGEYETALKTHMEALTIATASNIPSGIATSRGNIGNVYFYLNDYDATIEHYLAALEAYEQMEMPLQMMILNINIGNVYLKQGAYDQALAHLYTARELNKTVQNNDFIADAYNNMGIIYSAQNRHDEALEMHQMSLKIKEEVSDLKGIANSHKNLGVINMKLNNLEKSKDHLEYSLELSTQIGDKNSIYGVYRDLSSLDSLIGNFKDALTHYQLYTIYKDSIINEASNQAIAELKIQYETKKKDAEIALLSKAKEIQRLELDKNMEALKVQNLDIIRHQQEIEMQHLMLEVKDRELNQHQAELEAHTSKLEIALLEKELNEQEANKHKLQKRVMLFSILGLLVFMAGGIHFLLYRKRTAFKLKEASLELKALRAQMKPHFLFNALNSVRNYIQMNNNEKATAYLLNFSTLMRSVLNGSTKEEVCLSDELNTLKLYLELEKSNLEDKLSYTIHVDDQIETDNTMISPLLIQPFVENAILHGIAPKPTPGQITIRFRKNRSKLYITIEDDGIGREESLKKDKNNLLKTKSLGLEITKERLQMLSLKHNSESKVQFIDLEQGLRVELSIPFKEQF